jgi:Gas vesicle synthesis protein GvpL/GvpF
MDKEEGRYIYGIIGANHRQEFGPIGIGGRGDVVYTLPYQDVAAIISCSPIVKYPVSRENTITHAKVLEKVVEKYTVLPVRFCTISENEEVIVEKLLKARYQEFIDLLRTMYNKVELGLRARWKDLNAIFAEIAEKNKAIKTLKAEILSETNEQRKYANSIKVGELVQKALAEKRKREAEELLEALRPLSLDCKEMQFYGDMNIVNAAFLVEREKEQYFDQKVNELESYHNSRKQLKYTSSIVPYNFVNIVVHW